MSQYTPQKILSNFRIVLVNPQIPENIGLCARVVKNASFGGLGLVKPALKEKAFEVARRAGDILTQAQVHENVSDAIGESSIVIGTTRRRRAYQFVYQFNDLLPFLVAQAKKREVSILFGNERTGLTRDELGLCDSVFYLPANPKFPSYNLAVACAIVCYKIFEFTLTLLDTPSLDLACRRDIENLFSLIKGQLPRLAIKKKYINSILYSLKRILRRTPLARQEVSLLNTLLVKVSGKVAK